MSSSFLRRTRYLGGDSPVDHSIASAFSWPLRYLSAFPICDRQFQRQCHYPDIKWEALARRRGRDCLNVPLQAKELSLPPIFGYSQWDEDIPMEGISDARFTRLLDELSRNMRRTPAVYSLDDYSSFRYAPTRYYPYY